MSIAEPPLDHALNGRVLLRFAHAYETGGGTETYLADLDRCLLSRAALTIIRVELTRGPSRQDTEQLLGRGRLIRIALPTIDPSGDHSSGPTQSRIRTIARNWLLYNPAVWATVARRWALSRPPPRRPGEASDAGAAVAECFRQYPVDLVVMHFFGGHDADEVIAEARNARVPVALVNHYANARLQHMSVRKHVMLADAVAGVTGLHVPRYVRNRFTTVSDGIDLEFFDRHHARPVPGVGPEPVILLPARVVREKGHLDLVRAAAIIRTAGFDCTIALAGHPEPVFATEVMATAARFGLAGHVRLLGALDPERLRDWYATAAVIAFPTYHDEGLPRALLEAGAMGAPIVAYATGGVPDAVACGDTGFLVRTGAVRQLAMKLRHLLQHEPVRAGMGQRARRFIESRFSLAALGDRHSEFYASAICQKRPLATRVGTEVPHN